MDLFKWEINILIPIVVEIQGKVKLVFLNYIGLRILDQISPEKFSHDILIFQVQSSEVKNKKDEHKEPRQYGS